MLQFCNKHPGVALLVYTGPDCPLCSAYEDIRSLEEVRELLSKKDALIADLSDSLSRANEEANRHARKLLEPEGTAEMSSFKYSIRAESRNRLRRAYPDVFDRFSELIDALQHRNSAIRVKDEDEDEQKTIVLRMLELEDILYLAVQMIDDQRAG